MPVTKPDSYVIYSPSEATLNNGDGFWSNEDGWVDERSATHFSQAEVMALHLPHSTAQDARWQLAAEREGACA